MGRNNIVKEVTMALGRKPISKPKKGNPVQQVKLAERRTLVAALYCEGVSFETMAKQFQVTHETIRADVREIRKAWLERSVANYDQRKAEELAKIDRLEGEAWEGWHRSCRLLEITRTRTESVRQVPVRPKPVKGEPPPKQPPKSSRTSHVMIPIRTSTEVTVKGQTGDPRFLEQIAWCIETRLKVMGALKPDVTNVQVNQINWADMVRTPSQEDAVEALIEEVERQALVTPTPKALRHVETHSEEDQNVLRNDQPSEPIKSKIRPGKRP
jgi:hypothetical protein